MANTNQYYVALDDQVFGPYSFDEVSNLGLLPDTLVSRTDSVTLGLAGLAIIGVGETWRSNIFAGTSFDQGGMGFVMKIISFMIVSVIVAVPFFIISLIQLIYYSIKLSSTN